MDKSINERVRVLRNALGLSGENFGAKLGITRMAISKIENSKTGVTKANIMAICHTFNVNEEWLLTGKGEIFSPEPSNKVEELKELYSLTDFQTDIIKAYLNLSPDEKAVIDKFLKSCIK